MYLLVFVFILKALSINLRVIIEFSFFPYVTLLFTFELQIGPLRQRAYQWFVSVTHRSYCISCTIPACILQHSRVY